MTTSLPRRNPSSPSSTYHASSSEWWTWSGAIQWSPISAALRPAQKSVLATPPVRAASFSTRITTRSMGTMLSSCDISEQRTLPLFFDVVRLLRRGRSHRRRGGRLPGSVCRDPSSSHWPTCRTFGSSGAAPTPASRSNALHSGRAPNRAAYSADDRRGHDRPVRAEPGRHRRIRQSSRMIGGMPRAVTPTPRRRGLT